MTGRENNKCIRGNRTQQNTTQQNIEMSIRSTYSNTFNYTVYSTYNNNKNHLCINVYNKKTKQTYTLHNYTL